MDLTFLVAGAVPRKNASKLPSGQKMEKARLVELNWNKKTCTVKVDYYNPPKHLYPDINPEIKFNAFSVYDNLIYAPCTNEILVFEYPSYKLLQRISLPVFNDLHHVNIIDGKIYVVSTGLDFVIVLNKSSLEPEKYINVLGNNTWDRFNQDTDYRKINSTKPHDSHPNYVFKFNENIWVSRFHQKDIVNLYNFSDNYLINDEGIHDGKLIDNYLYFTGVDGKVIIFDITSLKIKEVIDLNKIENAKGALGWARGICVRDNVAFVGFTKLRPTSFTKNIKWATKKYMNNFLNMPTNTRIVAYDLKNKVKIDEFVFDLKDISMLANFEIIYG